MGFAGGICVDGVIEPELALWAALGCAALILAVWTAARSRAAWLTWLAALVLLVPVGGAWHYLRYRQRSPRHLASMLTGERWRCRVRGRIAREPELHLLERPFSQWGEGTRGLWICRTDVDALSADGESWIDVQGRLTVFVGAGRPEVLCGDEVEFLGMIRGNRPATNPGEISSRDLYGRHGEHGTASVPSAEAFRVRRRPAWHSSPRTAVGRLRAYLKERLIWSADRPLHPLAGALLFGERGRLSPEAREAVAQSGTFHFLAVSGLHVGIFAAFAWAALLWLRVPIRLRHVLLIALVWFFALFTGCRVPAMRAALMLSMISAAPLLGRRNDSLSGLLAAALIILIARPEALFTTGFQYSFLAVWAIFYLYAGIAGILWPWDGLLLRLQRPAEISLWDDLWRYGRHYLLMSTCIWLAVAPVAAYHFHRYCLLTPLVNLIVWPLMLVLILSSLATGALAAFGGVVCAAMVRVTEFFASRTMDLLEAAAGLRAFVIHTAGPPVWWIGLFYAVLAVWVMRLKLKGGRRVFLAGVAVLCGTYVWADLRAQRPAGLSVTVADVGHGQCVVFHSPSGGTMLYDAGASVPSRVQGAASILWHERIRRIDALVISHRDADHCCFVPHLARRFPVGYVLMPPAVGDGERIDSGLRSLGLNYTAVKERWSLRLDGLECDVLHPDARFVAAEGLSANERSLVVLCRAGGWKLLLTGDVQRRALARLVADRGEALRADVLLLPHHGAWEPGLREFVEQVRPRVAVASCTEPVDERTCRMLQELDIALWTTAEHGAITMTTDPKADGGELVLAGFSSGRRMRLKPLDSGGAVGRPPGESGGGGF